MVLPLVMIAIYASKAIGVLIGRDFARVELASEPSVIAARDHLIAGAAP